MEYFDLFRVCFLGWMVDLLHSISGLQANVWLRRSFSLNYDAICSLQIPRIGASPTYCSTGVLVTIGHLRGSHVLSLASVVATCRRLLVRLLLGVLGFFLPSRLCHWQKKYLSPVFTKLKIHHHVSINTQQMPKVSLFEFNSGSVSSVGRACWLRSGRARVRFPGPDQYSGS